MIEFERCSLPLVELGYDLPTWLTAVAGHIVQTGLPADLDMISGIEPVIQLPTSAEPGAPVQAALVLAWLRSLPEIAAVWVTPAEDFAGLSILGRLVNGHAVELFVIYDGPGWSELCQAADDTGGLVRDAVARILEHATGVAR